MHKSFQDFWHFSRRYRQFQRISNLSATLFDHGFEASQPTREALVQLNDRRIACQAGIAELNLPHFAGCGACNGACCREPTDHYYTAIDFWLRRYTPSRVDRFRAVRPLPLHQYYSARLSSALKALTGVPRPAAAAAHGAQSCCDHLSERGCRLPHEERPVRCLIYACTGMKRSLDPKTRLSYIEAVKDLQAISLETFAILKKEAGLPRHYGRASIFLTV